MNYRYVAYTADKRIIQGTIDAATESSAKDELWRSGHSVLSLKATRARRSFRQQFPTFFGVKNRDVVIFSRQLATLVERGINAFTALKILGGQIRNPAFRQVIAAVAHDLEQGKSFSEAVGKHPQAFPIVYSRMVEVGERTGNLPGVLRQVSQYMEKERQAIGRVRGAMIYPALVVLMACGVVAILMTFTLPPLLDMFAEFESDVPWTTKILLGTVDLAGGYWVYVLPAAMGAVVGTLLYSKTTAGRERTDALVLRVPVITPIVGLREMARACRTMSISLNSGLPMMEAMDLTIQTTTNSVVRRALEKSRSEVLAGRSLFQSMATNRLFPPLMTQMVGVGEHAGTLGKDLETVGDLYEEEVDGRVDLLLSMMQPALIIVLGLVVGFIAVSVIMPIYSIMGSI